ncbi:hypothetical protein [Methylomonas sp. MgM2]
MKFIKWLVAIVLLLPITAFTLIKPVRVLIPEAFGVNCSEHNVCVDDYSRLAEAVSLLNESKSFLAAQWGLSIDEPKIIFCSTEKCRSAFGLSNRAGFTFGNFGIVMAPRGWQQHYVTHELIHHWQAETFGSLVRWMAKPWLIEGMAYSLSNDPRSELHEPFESYRQQFNNWYRHNSNSPLKDAVGSAL